MKTRHVAQITIEAQTPLKVGSNASDFLQDAPLQKDFNGLPMILGTSLAGVLRKDFDDKRVNDLFGDEDAKKKDAKGSRLIISNALLLDENGKVHETLLLEKSAFLSLFEMLPIREHVAINEKGVAEKHKKFDEEILYKGSRFKFSIEVLGEKEELDAVLNLLMSSSFRIGGGSTKGFGKVKATEIRTQSFNTKEYATYSSSLNHTLTESYDISEQESKTHTRYVLKLTPDDFFIFGSGFGDSDADATPVYERVIDYDKKALSKKQILIPASSIKGALAHRTTFHYNVILGNTIEADNGITALEAIFGSAKEAKENAKEKAKDKQNPSRGSKGKLILSDCFKESKIETKTFDHVAIDRFTGGALDSALFNEKTIAKSGDNSYEIEILLSNEVVGDEKAAFELSLRDITTGMLPLGGMTTKGHGVFTGKLYVNGVEHGN